MANHRALQLRRNVVYHQIHRSDSEEDELLDELGSEDEAEGDLRARTEALNMLDNLVPEVNGENLQPDEQEPIPSLIEHVKTAQAFIEEIKKATLDNGKLDLSVIERLRNPNEEVVDVSDPDLRFSLEFYMSCTNASEATYNSVRKSILRRFPTKVLSHYLAKKLVSDISGVVCINDDMCINSCHAFTGPFEGLDTCTICSEPRYTEIPAGRQQKKVPRKESTTFPLGPQIQALRCSVNGANAVGHLDEKLKEIVAALETHEDELDTVYDDILC